METFSRRNNLFIPPVVGYGENFQFCLDVRGRRLCDWSNVKKYEIEWGDSNIVDLTL